MPRCSRIARWLTRTALGYVTLVVSFWLPFGLHRIIMGRHRRDWWHWPISYLSLAAGASVWIATGRDPIAIIALLGGGAWWFALLITDLLTMWTWRWPFTQTIADQFEALNKRFNLLENAGLFVIVALGMLFVARVA
jgi:hypothetical protein